MELGKGLRGTREVGKELRKAKEAREKVQWIQGDLGVKGS